MLLELIDRWALSCPERLAHQYREHTLTYADLKTNSDALALWIHEVLDRVEPTNSLKKSPIVVYGHKENEMLVAFLACAKAGHAYIPVDTSVPLERVRQILEASGTSLLLSPQTVPEELKLAGVVIQENFKALHNPKAQLSSENKQNSRKQFNLESPVAETESSSDILTPYLGQAPHSSWCVGEDDVYYIIFTSGSTGKPKGVQITLKALESFLDWVNPTYGPEKMKEVFLNQAPFSFDLSVMDLYMSLSNGGTLWSIDKQQMANARELFDSFARSNVSFWVSTPSFADICLMDKSFNQELLPNLKRFLFCGEVLSHDTASKLLERFPEALVENLYGPTEATVAVSTLTITPQVLERYNPLPVGRVKSDAQILICDTEALDEMLGGDLAPGNKGGQELFRKPPSPPQALPEGTRGEIVIAGPNVSIGYLNRPEQNRKSFFTWCDDEGKEWQAYRTGDAGLFEEGILFFFGRLDFQVKLHGYRIELGDIEENLRKLPEVENAVVLPIERRGKVDYLHAFLTTSEPVAEDFQTSQRLREELHKTLPDYMLPRRFTFLEKMPMTPNGKVDRRALGGGTR
jgi:D-alanine--poly(phosphoribitol) ligase subunit 1